MSFYNTTNLTGETLKRKRRKAVTQEDLVIDVYTVIGRPLGPSEVYQILIDSGTIKNTPITSIRRAISTLTKEGKLEMVEEKGTGLFGDPEHKWIIKRNNYESNSGNKI